MALSIGAIALVVTAFTPSEQKTIRNMKQRMTRIEATAAADKAAWQAEADVQAQRISSLEDAIDGITGDLTVLNENQVILSNDIDIIDAGLSGLVAKDGPLAQIDANLKMTQEIVFAAHPQIAITDIATSSTCEATICTAVIEWNSEPAATGQVEWGLTPEYGNFTQKENGGVLMDDDNRKKVLNAWQERKKEIILHPFLEEKIEFGLIPYAQAMLLARHLRGDLDAYPPFFWN